MPPSILLITGGPEQARRVFRDERRGDWAQATPLVLEKLGYLGFAVAGPRTLADSRTWEEHAVVLVPRLGGDAWSPAALDLAAAAGRTQLLVELPPPALRELAGVTAAEPALRLGSVTAVAPDLRAAVAAVSVRDATHLEPPSSRPIDRAPELDWPRLDVPITPDQAERWRAPGWEAERWEVGEDVEVLAEWIERGGGGRRSPAIVRRGRIVACAFSLLGFLGQQATVEPLAGPEHRHWPRCTALEALFAALLDDLHRRGGVTRARVLPWPEGAGWVLSIRHDFDRAQSRTQVNRVLQAHERAGTAATWYWRSRHLRAQSRVRVGSHPRLRVRVGPDRAGQVPEGAAIARRVASRPRQEVAHHTEQLWVSAERERQEIERVIRRPVAGTSAHGDASCFRWQGAPNVLWAERHGIDYTEFISHAHLHPHRFAMLGADGEITTSRVLCLPHHESFDRSTQPGDVAADSVLAAAEAHRRAGGLMQVLNHPDVNVEELFETLGRLPTERRLDWTAGEAADWWRRTHVTGELRLEPDDDGSVRVRSERGVRGAVLELLEPDGRRRRYAMHLEPGGAVVVGGPVAGLEAVPTLEQRWRAEYAPAYAEAARRYYAGRGIADDAESSQSTIAINSDLVPERVRSIRRYLAELGGVESLGGARVLDVGAGFGAVAAYLSLEHDAPRVTAIDPREDFVRLGQEVVQQLGLKRLTYQSGDMRSLEGIEDAAFDLVVVNNAFIYLTTADEMRRAAEELARVTAPGGHIFVFHANKWQRREPFTRAPVVHLLPRPAADALSRLTGWEHNRGRVRLVSAPAMRRLLERADFADVAVGLARGARIERPPRAWLGRYYAVVGRRPG